MTRTFSSQLQSLDDKIKILKSYITTLTKTNPDDDGFIIDFFIILHNWLIVENLFLDDVKSAGKEINKYLELEPLTNITDIRKKFQELYDTSNKVRFGIEILDSISSVDKYIRSIPDIHNKLIKIK